MRKFDSGGEAGKTMTLPYGNLITIWLFFGLLGAGFYVAYDKETVKTIGPKKRITTRRRQKILTGMLLIAVALGPLSVAASIVDMLRRRTWYGWTLW